MKLITTYLAAILLTSCVTMRLERWRSAERTGAVSVVLCSACSQPYDYQIEDAQKMITERCGGDYTVVEEGSSLSGDYGAGYGMVQAEHKWYWAFKCNKT